MLRQEEQTSRTLKAELAAFGAADPVKYERKKEAVRVAKEAAQRWTGGSQLSVPLDGIRSADESRQYDDHDAVCASSGMRGGAGPRDAGYQ